MTHSKKGNEHASLCWLYKFQKPKTTIQHQLRYTIQVQHSVYSKFSTTKCTHKHTGIALTGSVCRKTSLNCEEHFEIVVLVRGGGRERRQRLQGHGSHRADEVENRFLIFRTNSRSSSESADTAE
jgi:hypothetical protein